MYIVNSNWKERSSSRIVLLFLYTVNVCHAHLGDVTESL